MKFINKLRWNHYVILTILFIIVVIALFCMIKPLNSGSTEEILENTDIVTTEMIRTTNIKTVTGVTMPSTAVSTSTTTTSTTTTKSAETTAEVITTTLTEVVTVQTTEEITTEPYVVYKPSTHYIHKSTCRWANSSCIEIDNTEDIECRKCTECDPDMEIVNEYTPEVPVVTEAPITTEAETDPEPTVEVSIESSDRQLLAEIVWYEAGSDWISLYNKAKIAAGVMNRVNDARFPNTVYGVLTSGGQFPGFTPGYNTPSQSCYDAVDYYLTHLEEFNGDNSWYGSGGQNHFYRI